MRVVFYYIKKASVAIVLAAAFLCTISMPASAAESYDDNPYSTCAFNKSCPQTSIIETKSGLQVAINLVEGQVISTDTYKIEVTPLNGQGASFARVEFYVDGWLVGTFLPDTTGTATYDWDTKKHAGTLVGFKIFDQNGDVITKEFHVVLREATPTEMPIVSATNTPPTPTAPQGLIEQAIRALPAEVALSIPYILYGLLLITLLVLVVHARREALAAHRAKIALLQSQKLVEEKDGFIELISHYLRTPLALIKGSADLIAPSQPTLVERIRVPIEVFGASIERLIDTVMQNQQLQSIDKQDTAPRHFLWLTPGVWTVVIGIALLAGYINYALFTAGITDLSLGGSLTQAAVFVLLLTCLIVTARSRYLSAKERRRAEVQAKQQAAIDEARNNLIREAASDLSSKLESIRAALPQLPDESAGKLFKEGCARAAEVLRRFKATAQVTPPVSTMPFATFTLGQAIERVKQYLGDTLQSKHITITSPQQDATLASQQPAWIVQTLNSVIDNAIAYSPNNATIDISVAIEHGTAVVNVRDHGQGIPQDKINRLFKPFSRAEAPTQFDHPGLGLIL